MWVGFFLFFGFLSPAQAEVRFSVDTYLSHSDVSVYQDGVNPGNMVLELPHSKTDLDLRPELKLREGTWQAVLRPRLIESYRQVDKATGDETLTKSDPDITDAFVEKNWSGKFSTTVGLQVYQWGPAEFLNSSNPFSHFNPQQKNLLYKEKGRGLIRANYSFNKENNLVAAYEPISNQQGEWIAEDEFVAKGFLKYEKSWSGTLDAVGLSLGQAEKNNFFVGEYFSYHVTEGFSLYADLKQQKDNVNFRPVWNGTSYDMLEDEPHENRWSTLAVAGIRWEQVFDWRLEYIYNQAGYDADELDAAIQSASNILSPLYAQNAARFYRPGLELLGRNYLYSSFRLTDPAWIQNFSFYLRFLYSFQDESSSVQLEIEKSFFDAWTFYAGQSLSTFESHTIPGRSEFRLAQSDESFVGVKWSY
jgi:hypothetical protein